MPLRPTTQSRRAWPKKLPWRKLSRRQESHHNLTILTLRRRNGEHPTSWFLNQRQTNRVFCRLWATSQACLNRSCQKRLSKRTRSRTNLFSYRLCLAERASQADGLSYTTCRRWLRSLDEMFTSLRSREFSLTTLTKAPRVR